MANKKFVMSVKCCRHLKSAPNKPCQCAIDKIEGRHGCDWFINDSQSNYCFWYYMYLNPKKSHSVTQISCLWGSSVNNISIAMKSCLKKIKDSL